MIFHSRYVQLSLASYQRDACLAPRNPLCFAQPPFPKSPSPRYDEARSSVSDEGCVPRLSSRLHITSLRERMTGARANWTCEQYTRPLANFKQGPPPLCTAIFRGIKLLRHGGSQICSRALEEPTGLRASLSFPFCSL